MKWFRLYNETIHDRKLRRLPPAQRWLWIAVLCAASDSPERGRLLLSDGEPVTVDDLVDMAALPIKAVRDGLATLERLGMLAVADGVISVTKWSQRQHKSDNSTDRWRKWKSQQVENDDPTPDKQPTNVGEALDKPPTNVSARGYARPTDTDTELTTPNGVAIQPENGHRESCRSSPEQQRRERIFETFARLWLDLDWPALSRDERRSALTKSERGRINNAVGELIDKPSATCDEIERRWSEALKRAGPDYDVTPQTVTKSWSSLGSSLNGQRIQTAEEVYGRLD